MITYIDSQAPVALALKNISPTVQNGDNKRTILGDISPEIRAGEIVGLVGPPGSGKPTLPTIAGCLESINSGHAMLYLIKQDSNSVGADRSVERTAINLSTRGVGVARTRHEHIGIAFQQPNPPPALTAKQQFIAMRQLGYTFR